MGNIGKIDNIWFLSDIHFGVRSNNLDWMEIHKQYFNDFFIPMILAAKNNNESNIIFILGDIFDNRQSMNILVQNMVLDIFNQLSQICPIYCLLGNHDIYYKNSNSVNSIKILQPYITKIFSEPTTKIFNSTSFGIMPWVEDKSKEQSIMESFINEKLDYVLCHTEIQNFKFNNFRQIENGLKINKNISTKRIISGHIHIRQEDEKVLFIGSPISLNRGDIGNVKGVYKLNLDSNKFTFFENKLSPRFIEIFYSDLIEMDVNYFKKYIKNNFIDIKIPIGQMNTFPVTKLYDLVTDIVKSIKIIPINMNNNINDLLDDEINQKDFNILNLMKEFIIKIDYNKTVKKNIYSKIKRLYQEAETKLNEDIKC